MTDQPTYATLALALVALQAAMPRIAKSDRGQAGNRETRYANLATITEAIQDILAAHGFAWTCAPTYIAALDKFVLHYELLYGPTGEAKEGDYPLPVATPQTIGGAITYARRYALCAVLNIAPAEDDDDAQEAADALAGRATARANAIGLEHAASPPPHTRLADRSKGRLPDDEWTREPASEAP